ncbi:MAG: ankyrin repeat domain-containing protein [Candidatus Krumholzibacteria bacterium]|nr:ankyrin repeat domain-containing protein [Candidatus Krumholzibacteria bacterium]
MTFPSTAFHIRKTSLTFMTLVLVFGGLMAIGLPRAIADTPKPEYRGKEPDDGALMNMGDSALELMGEDDHGNQEDELQGRLFVALGYDDVLEAKMLLEAGADINRPVGGTGQTPVMAAESLEMATMLCDGGAKPQARDLDGGTVLHYAVSRDAALELIPFFVSRGVDINARGWDNEPPLLLAVTYFNEHHRSDPENVLTGVEVVALMVELGADINAVDEYGNTVLMQCTVADNAELVETLLELGADTGIRNNGDSTAREIAYELGRRHIYQLLD